jgi:hypothetical protein
MRNVGDDTRAHRYAKYIHILGFLDVLWSPRLVVAFLRFGVNFDWSSDGVGDVCIDSSEVVSHYHD